MSDATKRLRERHEKAVQARVATPAALAGIGGETEEGHAYLVALCQTAPFLLDVCEAFGAGEFDVSHDWRCWHYKVAKGKPCVCGLDKFEDALAALSSPPDRQETT